MTEKKIIVTSGLPYANGSIHIGHLIEYIQTDIFVKFLKLNGKNAVYVCGDDAHGAPISINAQKQGMEPKEFIKKYFKEHIRDFKSFNIEFDSYYTTHSDENKYFSEYIYNKAKEKGLIYQKEIEQYYCEECKRFLPDRYVRGICPKCQAEEQYGDICEVCGTTYQQNEIIDPHCAICDNIPILKNSEHYFFKLSAFSKKLGKWLKENKNLQTEVRNQINEWIENGLEDWCISRDEPYFGFKIPDTKNKYFYVWLDAPIGYISSNSKLVGGKKEGIKDWNNSEIIHFIGKDIMYFHLLFWPALLMAAEIRLPKNIVVHGFLNVNKKKMSKSRGTFLTAKEMLEYVKPDHLRFYYAGALSRNIVDIDLDFKHFVEKINNELVANIANFFYRSFSFSYKHFDGKYIKHHEPKLEKEIKLLIEDIKRNYENCELSLVVKDILKASDIGNKYFQDNKPWELIKTDKEKCHQVLSFSINLAKNIAILLKPIMPEFISEIEEQLGKKLTYKEIGFGDEGKINKPKIIEKKIEEIKLNINGDVEQKEQDQFSKLNLVVGKITDIKKNEESEKLYIEKVDIGEKEEITLQSGLVPYYKPEELLGRDIIVVKNLKPKKMLGTTSHGMLLACNSKENDVGVLLADGSKPGEKVVIEGKEPSEEPIDIKEFFKIKLIAKDGKVYYKEKVLKTKKGQEIKIDRGIVEGSIS